MEYIVDCNREMLTMLLSKSAADLRAARARYRRQRADTATAAAGELVELFDHSGITSSKSEVLLDSRITTSRSKVLFDSLSTTSKSEVLIRSRITKSRIKLLFNSRTTTSKSKVQAL